MLTIARRQILEGLLDAKFLLVSALILLAFLVNAFVFSESYWFRNGEWQHSLQEVANLQEKNVTNLQRLANVHLELVKPPSALAFIADGGDARLPDTWTVTAFLVRDPKNTLRGNSRMPLVGALDWVFIIGTLMSLLAIIVGFDAICGEKSKGTLKVVLSFPLSRLKLFLGKYLGLLFVMLIVLFLGVLINISSLFFLGVLKPTEPVLSAIGQVLILAVLYLSFVLLGAMTVSSLVARPVVSMVVLLVLWMAGVIVVPGLARPVAEMSVPVKPGIEVKKLVDTALEELHQNASEEALTQYNDPFHPNVPKRAEHCRRRLAIQQNLEDEAELSKIRQAEMISTISAVSPYCLFDSALQELAGTGVAGFRLSMESARRYRQQLYNFTAEIDRTDRDSPHQIYSWGNFSDRGVFSSKPVEYTVVPKWQGLWLEGGMPAERSVPWFHIVLLLAANLQLAIIGFIALACYDPR